MERRTPLLAGAVLMLAATQGLANGTATDATAATAEPAAESLPPPEREPGLTEAVIERAMPLSPEEVRVLRDLLEQQQQAAHKAPPKSARMASVTVDLEPGAQSPMLKLVHGFVSAIEILDVTGAPWPITTTAVGDPRALNLVATEAAPNVITLTPQTPFASTNVVLTLEGRSTPVALVVQATSPDRVPELTDRIALIVRGHGPNAIAPVTEAPLPRESQALQLVLDGIAPPEAERLDVSVLDVTAYRRGATLFLRSRHALISPAATTILHGAHETRAYELAYTPVILMLADGAPQQVRLSERQTTKERS